jgi:hypothetical protein
VGVAAELKQALAGEVQVTGALLTATDDTTRERLGRREIGSALDWHVRRSRKAAEELEAESPAAVARVPTDGRTVADIATEIIKIARW